MKGGMKQGMTGICSCVHASQYFHYDLVGRTEGMKAVKKSQILWRQNVKWSKKKKGETPCGQVHLSSNKQLSKLMLGDNMLASISAEKDLEVIMNYKLNLCVQRDCVAEKANIISRCMYPVRYIM